MLTESVSPNEARSSATRVERWSIFEIVIDGPQSRNPFIDVWLTARFENGANVYEPDGFS